MNQSESVSYQLQTQATGIYWRKRTTVFGDMFWHAYAIFSLIVNNKYVIQLYNTKYDRTFKINNTSSGFHNDLIKPSDTLKCNSFPSHIIDKTFKRYLNKPSDQKSHNVNDENNTSYFKLPFIGRYSRITELKLRQLLKRFCETDLNCQINFYFFQNQKYV